MVKQSIWRRIVSWFSKLSNRFWLKRKPKALESEVPKAPKDPIIQAPAIKKETAMELVQDQKPNGPDLEGILDQAASIANKAKTPEPPQELLSDQEAGNAAKMLPLLLALSMATMGPPEVEKVEETKKKTQKKPLFKFSKREMDRMSKRKKAQKRSK